MILRKNNKETRAREKYLKTHAAILNEYEKKRLIALNEYQQELEKNLKKRQRD